MNWIDGHSQNDEGVTVASCRINPLLFAGDLSPLPSSQLGLPQILDRFSAACDQIGIKISIKNEVLCLSRNPKECALQAWATEVGGQGGQGPLGFENFSKKRLFS